MRPLALLTACVCLAGCGAERVDPKTERPPNVVVISVDALRRDHLSAYGYGRPTSPRLKRLAAEGARFDGALSPTPWTLPAHASLFTGLPASAHQVEHAGDRLPESLATVATLFAAGGWTTAGYVSADHFDPLHGLARGFATWDLEPARRATAVTDGALSWLDTRPPERPFLLFLHYVDPHWPLDPPAEHLTALGGHESARSLGTFANLIPYAHRDVPMSDNVLRRLLPLYHGEIRYVDTEIGRLLDGLNTRGLDDDTIVLVTSDHGEEFGEHDGFGHGLTLHAEVTRVPLIVRWPGRIAAGAEISVPVSIADVAPTLVALAGLELPEQLTRSAADLSAALLGTGPVPNRPIVLETTHSGAKRLAIVSRGHTYIPPRRFPNLTRAGRGWSVRRDDEPASLFALVTDPLDRHDLLDVQRITNKNVTVARALRRELGQWIETTVPGVRLVCAGEEGKDLEGEVTLDVKVVDEPFGLGLVDEDRIAPADLALLGQPEWKAREFTFAFERAERRKGIVFPIAPATTSFAVRLRQDGTALVDRTVAPPAPGDAPIDLGHGCLLEPGPPRVADGAG